MSQVTCVLTAHVAFVLRNHVTFECTGCGGRSRSRSQQPGRMRIHIHMNMYIYAGVYSCKNMCVYMYMYIYMHTHIHMYMYMYQYIYIYMHMCTCIYIQFVHVESAQNNQEREGKRTPSETRQEGNHINIHKIYLYVKLYRIFENLYIYL